MTGRRLLATATGIAAVVAAFPLAGFGVLLWLAIPSSDTATSSLVLVGLALFAAGAGLAAVGWVHLRRGLRQP